MNDQPTNQPTSIDQAATLLGITREAVRLRIRRGTLRGERRIDGWVVWLVGQATSDQPARPTDQRPTSRPRSESPRTAALHAELEAVRHERDALAAALERSQQGEAELRRMLNLEQQTVAALRALPATVEMPLERAEPAATAPDTGEPPETPPVELAVVRELKRAGVKGKKQRRRLLERLAGLWQ